MKRKIAILGSTGSIGKTLLKIIEKDKSNFEIILLSANKNYKQLIKQAKFFNVKNLIITDKKTFKLCSEKNYFRKYNIFNNYECFNKIIKKKIDYTMSAIIGIDGLYPTLKIINFTKKIAIANKEAIVCGWNLISKLAIKNKTQVIPVDSEHFSIWSLLNYRSLLNKQKSINHLIDEVFITASGGPFQNFKKSQLKFIKPEQAVKHPNWKMGQKISIDSSTLMNKVFEVIEVQRLFKIDPKRIKIIVQPSSYIHAIVKFTNGTIKLLAHEPNMKVPIFNSLYQNNPKYKINSKKVNFNNLSHLDFKPVDVHKFPIIKIIKKIDSKVSLFETAITVANDELVNLFIKKKISYLEISKFLNNFLKTKYVKSLKRKSPSNYSKIQQIKKFVRLKIKNQYN